MLTPGDIDKLGRRIAKAVVQSAEDLRDLAAIQERYQAASRPVGEGLSEVLKEWKSAHDDVALTMSSRSKTPGTIVEKVRRGTRLSTMQDIVGFRISAADSPGDFKLSDQTKLAQLVQSMWANTRLIDRRTKPSAGYRAVHIVISSGGLPVELQIRTYLQDRWANETEALADAWGRGIRYGLPPEGADADEIRRRSQVVDANKAISDLMYDWEFTVDRLRSELAEEFVGRAVSQEEAGARARERLANELAPVQDRLIAALADFRQLRGAVG